MACWLSKIIIQGTALEMGACIYHIEAQSAYSRAPVARSIKQRGGMQSGMRAGQSICTAAPPNRIWNKGFFVCLFCVDFSLGLYCRLGFFSHRQHPAYTMLLPLIVSDPPFHALYCVSLGRTKCYQRAHSLYISAVFRPSLATPNPPQ